MSHESDFETDLRDMMGRGQVIAVLGSGVSLATTSRAPSWRGLIDAGVEHCRTIGVSEDWCQYVRGQLQLASHPDMLLSAAGNIRHRELVALASDFFASFPARAPRQFKFPRARFRPRRFHKKNKNLNQCYVLAAMESVSLVSSLRHPIMIMNDILGGGMSSRLFQGIREEKGLAYTISSFIDSYLECGVQIIYAVIEPEKVGDYLEAVRSEIGRLRKKGIHPDELDRAKDHIKSSIILSLENNVAKMRFKASQELYLGREQRVADIIAEINATTRRDINGFCGKYLDLEEGALLTYGRCHKSPAWEIKG